MFLSLDVLSLHPSSAANNNCATPAYDLKSDLEHLKWRPYILICCFIYAHVCSNGINDQFWSVYLCVCFSVSVCMCVCV